MKRRFILLALVAFVSAALHAQLVYPIVGQYKNKSAQGMAIWHDYAFLMNDGGYCRVYHLKSEKVIDEFPLGSANKDNHVNNSCFGNESLEEGNPPVIYITECKKQYRCFVEKITSHSSELVQTICAKEKGKNAAVLIWVTDAVNGYLYSVTRSGEKLDSIGSVANTITKYRLPKLNEGENIVLNENDVLNRFVVVFPNILQGAKIKNNNLYIVTGLQETLSHRQDAHRAILIIDLKHGRLKKTIDLTRVTTNEPEDMDFYRNTPLLYCGQNGGLYKVKLK